ncbi:MAG TPA: hypothetical protein VGL95_14760 [Acetobacteraceae bacterium]|jgi:hypothetical protein
MPALTLIPVVLDLLEAGVTIVPEIVTAAQTEYALFSSSTPPTAAQQATIDAALETANNALQAATQAA